MLTLLACALATWTVTFAVLGFGLLSALLALGLGELCTAPVYRIHTAT